MQNCPCGKRKAYLNCCGAFISNQKNPSTPEELMRSRYTAYHQANFDYIIQTMKSPAADHFDIQDAKRWALSINWLRLEIVSATQKATTGTVEFRAYYSIDNKKNVLREVSAFNFENGKWYYVSGTHPT